MTKLNELIVAIVEKVGSNEILKEHRKIFCLCPECKVKDICTKRRYDV